MAKNKKHIPFYRKKPFLWTVGIIVGLVIVILLAFRLSPWPGALVVRTVFNKGGHKTLVAMQKALPNYPVTVLEDQQYRAHDKTAFLDVYTPNKAMQQNSSLPVVIWTHGGGWLSGNKSDDAPYFKRLADQGYTVIALNYGLAPGKPYPYALHQINDAYAYIQANAARFHANTNKIMLAGDSAGAQLSSQLAAIITNPAYAKEVNMQPNLQPSQLSGVVLFCGIYKMEGLTEPDPTLPKIVGWGDNVTVWAYTGSKDKKSPLIRQMSAYYHATKDFPSTFISGGNGDPLTNAQSVPFASELQAMKVDVTTLFYPKDHTPSLPHEYQFTFNNDGQKAFTAMLQFLQAKTK
jgi:acetyl esterase